MRPITCEPYDAIARTHIRFSTARIATLVVYPFLHEFTFAHPILTIAGERGVIQVDLNRIFDRPISESRLHVATWYCQQRGFG